MSSDNYRQIVNTAVNQLLNQAGIYQGKVFGAASL